MAKDGGSVGEVVEREVRVRGRGGRRGEGVGRRGDCIFRRDTPVEEEGSDL